MGSSETTPVRSRRVAHFTHLDNLVAILEADRLVCDSIARGDLLRTEVGDPQIKEARRGRRVPIAPGGRVGDYVPFYFAPRSPMMFRIACDCRGRVTGRYADGDRRLVYLVATIGAVVDAGLDWVGTDGNAASATTAFTSTLHELNGMVDWPLMRAQRWSNTQEDPDRQRRRMAEFMVHREVPLIVFHQVAVFDQTCAPLAQRSLGQHPLAASVVVRPAWY
ncbi:DUF4433 domain-containing protein [Natronosporangium hydrolyticum]|uniref:DUF4433 domain-containing protein n=1 Tax=Natronosporangium hydrolyticum TaxID=2811111 RepID=A0A895YG76_9ACTN|nr:DUF4433 domain-containing protein [Natronosporangium hydrolyticum]QSB14489.1 DUF4433 domain-containing protein [Natronosporangium hydrolyticum]